MHRIVRIATQFPVPLQFSSSKQSTLNPEPALPIKDKKMSALDEARQNELKELEYFNRYANGYRVEADLPKLKNTPK